MNREELIQKIKELHKELGRRPKKRDNNSLSRYSRLIFGSWNKLMEAAGYTVKFYQKPKIPKKLTPHLAYFLGILITDGHLQYNCPPKKAPSYMIQLYTSYEEERELLLKLIEELFGYKSSVRHKLYGFNIRKNY